MGPLGWPETVFIFFLALILFGPKKLPELGRTVGKALTEFRRASNELKATFDREMKSLEQETESIHQAANEFQAETYNYDYSSPESNNEGAYGYDNSYGSYSGDSYDSTASSPSTLSASAPQDAESHAAQPEGTIAQGSEPEAPVAAPESAPHTEPGPAGSGASAAPHNA